MSPSSGATSVTLVLVYRHPSSYRVMWALASLDMLNGSGSGRAVTWLKAWTMTFALSFLPSMLLCTGSLRVVNAPSMGLSVQLVILPLDALPILPCGELPARSNMFMRARMSTIRTASTRTITTVPVTGDASGDFIFVLAFQLPLSDRRLEIGC